jgi:hypothetical protein
MAVYYRASQSMRIGYSFCLSLKAITHTHLLLTLLMHWISNPWFLNAFISYSQAQDQYVVTIFGTSSSVGVWNLVSDIKGGT